MTTAMAGSGPLVISKSVGAGGANLAADVKAVRARLVELGFSWVAGATDVGPKFVNAIRLFQAIKGGYDIVNVTRVDGRVDPNGDTLRWLNAKNAPRWVRMTPQAKGLFNYEATQVDDGHDYGTTWLDEMLIAAGQAYANAWLVSHPTAPPITVNDASLPEGGDTPAHKGHETGLVCDLRLPRKDGKAGGIKTTSASYDRDTMRAQLEALRAQPLFDVAFLNDDALIQEGLCRPLGGHDDHVHVEIKAPDRTVAPPVR